MNSRDEKPKSAAERMREIFESDSDTEIEDVDKLFEESARLDAKCKELKALENRLFGNRNSNKKPVETSTTVENKSNPSKSPKK